MVILLSGLTCQSPQINKYTYPENEIPVNSTSEEAMQAFLAGLEILDQRYPQKARPYFDEALTLDPNFVSAQMYRAFSSNSAKDFAENRDKFLAMRDKANDSEVIWMDIIITDMEGDDKKELELSKKLVKMYPKSARAYDNLAVAYNALDDIEEARNQWKKAMELDPKYLPAVSNLGLSYLFISPKDFKMAEDYMAKAVCIGSRKFKSAD